MFHRIRLLDGLPQLPFVANISSSPPKGFQDGFSLWTSVEVTGAFWQGHTTIIFWYWQNQVLLIDVRLHVFQSPHMKPRIPISPPVYPWRKDWPEMRQSGVETMISGVYNAKMHAIWAMQVFFRICILYPQNRIWIFSNTYFFFYKKCHLWSSCL